MVEVPENQETSGSEVRPEKPKWNESPFWQKVSTWAQRGLTEVQKFTHIGKLKFDATKQQQERGEIYRQLGITTYELIKKDQFNADEIRSLMDQIDDLNQRIDSHQEQIKTMAQVPPEGDSETQEPADHAGA